MKSQKTTKDKHSKIPSGIKIGMFKGEKYIAEEYDLDQDNDEIARQFEGANEDIRYNGLPQTSYGGNE